MEIIVGSESPIKLDATRDAVARLVGSAIVEGRPTLSGVPDQPFGDFEAICGAMSRASAIEAQTRDLEVRPYAVGIESGVVPRGRGSRFCDLAYVVVVSPVGDIVVRRSLAVSVPADLVEQSRASGWRTTCGQLEAARSGCDPNDPHVEWSRLAWHGQAVGRRYFLGLAIEEALAAAGLGVAP